MNSDNFDIHKTIGLIYTTAADPEQWPELLNALANFVDALPPTDQTSTTNLQDKLASLSPDIEQSSTSLAAALKQLPTLNNENTCSELVTNTTDVSSVLLSHFRNALQVSQRLVGYEDEKDMIASLLNRLPIAIIIVNEAAEIIECNDLAQSILEKGNLLYLERNRLTVHDKLIANQLQETIAKLAHTAPSAMHNQALMLSHKTDKQDDMMAYLSPIKGNNSSDNSHVAIFISRPKSQPFILPSSIATLYSLTKKESEITALLVRGFSIKEIVKEQYVSENTIRTHVKAILRKTGLRRQSDLIRLVLSGSGEGVPDSIQLSANDLARQNNDSKRVRTIILPDGRQLSYQEYGAADGIPMIFLHSVRGCHLEIENLAAKAAYDKGIRLIAPNRPGFSLSDPKHLNSVLDYVQDIVALADALELEKFNLAGYVLGGLFAKAVAYSIPERIDQLLLISCGVTARTTEDFENMIPLYKMSNKLARDLPQVMRMLSSIMVRGMLRNPKRFFDQFATQLEPEEAALFQSTAFRERIFKGLQEAAHQGSRHIGREVELLNQPWGFDPALIEVPTRHWHGKKDRHIPCILGEKLAALQPNSCLNIMPNNGHFMAYLHMPKIFEDFIENL